ncbi:nucleolar transcription factor 1-B-like [Rhinoderma darwinii]|uniref:nucleolar transcription factor 1-B-like n=1 Tax=Rhinoderma darwinii TaxID=43563 RepID=UPI003F668989
MTAPSDQDNWSQEDMLILLETMKTILPSIDRRCKTTESQLDWNKLAFKTYTGDTCRKTWRKISSEVRRYRTLTELLQDAKEHVRDQYKGEQMKLNTQFPRKPLTPYFRFFLEEKASYAKLHPEMSNLDICKNLSQKYKELTDSKKAKYIQDFQNEREDYQKNLAKFKEAHPDLLPYSKKSDTTETHKTPLQQPRGKRKRKRSSKIGTEKLIL